MHAVLRPRPSRRVGDASVVEGARDLRNAPALRRRYEREADDFAHELLIDAEGFVHSWEIAEHFEVPGNAVRVQARLVADDPDSQPGDRPRRGY